LTGKRTQQQTAIVVYELSKQWTESVDCSTNANLFFHRYSRTILDSCIVRNATI